MRAADLLGEWGGEHIALAVSAGGATLEYDCAHGTIDEPIVPNDDGDFNVQGTDVREVGGPAQGGVTPDVLMAGYRGTTDGRRMTLTVSLPDLGEVVGTFELTLGETAQIFRCV